MGDNDGGMKKDFVTGLPGPETIVDVLEIHEEAVVQQADLVKNFRFNQNAGEGHKLGWPEGFFRELGQIKVSGEGKTPIDRALEAVEKLIVLEMFKRRSDQTGLRFLIKYRQQGREKKPADNDIRVNDQDMTGSLLEGERDTEVVATGKAKVLGRFN